MLEQELSEISAVKQSECQPSYSTVMENIFRNYPSGVRQCEERLGCKLLSAWHYVIASVDDFIHSLVRPLLVGCCSF